MSLFVGTMALVLMAQPAQAEIEFGIPTPIIGPEDDPINGVHANVHGWLSPDELTLHFASTRPTEGGGLGDIWVSTRESTSADWLTRENLGAPINSGVVDYMPSLTADQKEIYYARTTDPFGGGDAEIWVAQRPSADAAWNAPVKLSITEPGDLFPVISPNGLELYFTSVSRDTDESPTIGNIWFASRTTTSESFGEPEFVQSGWGNTLSTDGLTFAFYGNSETFPFYDVPRVGGQDVLLRSRDVPDGDFGPVFNPWAPLNSSFDDYITQFTPSGDYVLLSSFRPGVPTGGIIGEFGLWQVPIAEAVPVDVKPGSDVAPINLKSKGELPVAILSTEDFTRPGHRRGHASVWRPRTDRRWRQFVTRPAHCVAAVTKTSDGDGLDGPDLEVQHCETSLDNEVLGPADRRKVMLPGNCARRHR